MIKKDFEVSLLDITLMVSHAVDLISSVLYNHHKQVAYIACQLGKELNLPLKDQENLLIAGLLHDVGGLSLQTRLSSLEFEAQNLYQHGVIGYFLLRQYEKFQEIATIIKYHHASWENGKGRKLGNNIIPFESHIIHLADRIAVLVNRDEEILSQVPRISFHIEKENKKKFHPEFVEAFRKLQIKESFWLDVVV